VQTGSVMFLDHEDEIARLAFASDRFGSTLEGTLFFVGCQRHIERFFPYTQNAVPKREPVSDGRPGIFVEIISHDGLHYFNAAIFLNSSPSL
jgi:hypothetical protein